MRYILSAKEYKQLIHKDQIKKPVDEFLKEMQKLIPQRQSYSPHGLTIDDFECRVNIEAFRSALETLRIKLDL